MFKLVPLVVLIIVGLILFIYAAFSLGVCDGEGCHMIFAVALALPDVLATFAGALDLFFLSITK